VKYHLLSSNLTNIEYFISVDDDDYKLACKKLKKSFKKGYVHVSLIAIIRITICNGILEAIKIPNSGRCQKSVKWHFEKQCHQSAATIFQRPVLVCSFQYYFMSPLHLKKFNSV
jgi:hypothetical protein